MTNFKTKLATGLVTAGILASSFAPAAMAANIKIKHNGAKSVNAVAALKSKVTSVSQYNSTAVVNLVGGIQNTGGNKANGNTGKKSEVIVASGNARANVTNETKTGGNRATVNGCCCDEGGDTIVIKNNGAFSKNAAYVSEECTTVVEQGGETLVVNGVLVGQNTGLNSASWNTGGTVYSGSGNAVANVSNTTNTGSNTLVIN